MQLFYKFLLLICIATSGSAAAYLFKLWARSQESLSYDLASLVRNIPSIMFDPRVIGGIFLQIFSMLLFMFLLTRYQLSNILPIQVGLTVVLTVTVATIVLHEPFGMVKAAGIALVIVGITVIEHA